MNIFNPSRSHLISKFESLQHDYKQAQPYPHLVIDNLFAPEILGRIATDLSSEGDRKTSQGSSAVKQRSFSVSSLSDFARTFYFWLNSFDFIAPLTLVVDKPRKSLIGDPTYYGAGLYEMPPNTKITGDKSLVHPRLPLACKYNLIVCLDRTKGDRQIEVCSGENNRASYDWQFNRTFVLPMTEKIQYKIKNNNSDRHCCQFLSIYYWQ